jgi:hypothetical protein
MDTFYFAYLYLLRHALPTFAWPSSLGSCYLYEWIMGEDSMNLIVVGNLFRFLRRTKTCQHN